MEMREELKKRTGEVESIVDSYLPAEEGYQKTIFEAMNYSVRAGGKRLRPMLMEETYHLFGGTEKAVEPFMAAMEMIHTSSLIHDDLPCMDNDELRRGLPTTWKKFGYDMAVLAGDALMIYAFETASRAFAMTRYPDRAARAIQVLAEKTGIYGMIGGQVLDMLAEHRRISETELRLLQKLKTGCLLRAACELGCAAAGKTDAESIEAARAYGDKLGLAFQIEDDILDIEGDEKTLGKSIGKDAASEKSTFPSLLGLDACRKLAGELTEQAVAALAPYEGRAFLETLARSLTGRRS